jgi:hypothetical protein
MINIDMDGVTVVVCLTGIYLLYPVPNVQLISTVDKYSCSLSFGKGKKVYAFVCDCSIAWI